MKASDGITLPTARQIVYTVASALTLLHCGCSNDNFGQTQSTIPNIEASSIPTNVPNFEVTDDFVDCDSLQLRVDRYEDLVKEIEEILNNHGEWTSNVAEMDARRNLIDAQYDLDEARMAAASAGC
jgi:hypothetical protein